MLYDKNNTTISKGDSVLVPEGNDSDIHVHEFVGTVTVVGKEYVTVEDGDGDSFEIEPERLEVQGLIEFGE